MAGSMSARVGGLPAVFLACSLGGTGLAQQVTAQPEVVPAPQPARPPQQVQPQSIYDPIQAIEDAYRLAEQQRQLAVSRQLQLVQSLWSYQTYPVPYVAPVPIATPVYVYGSPRALRRAYRYGYWTTPQLPVPVGAYAYPSSTWIQQPIGYQQIWISPNSYVYRPYYGQPAQQQNAPAPSPRPGHTRPPTRTAPPADQPSGPALSQPAQPAPERIPVPPAQPVPDGS